MAKNMTKTRSNKKKRATQQGGGEKGGLRPLADRVIIREDDAAAEKKTSAGIIIPGSVAEDKSGKRGTVIAVGPGRIENGKAVAPAIKAGDKVLFQWGDKVKIGEEELYIVRESEILAIIK